MGINVPRAAQAIELIRGFRWLGLEWPQLSGSGKFPGTACGLMANDARLQKEVH
jgi:hypothetical protein